MFSFTFIVAFILFLLACLEFKNGCLGWKTDAVSPAMGFVYSLISAILFFVISLWWTAMATDAALSSLGMFWTALAWTASALAFACICLILLATVGNKQNDDGGRLSIRDERLREDYT